MGTSNFRHRVLRESAEEFELPKLTFQVIRRTIATLAHQELIGTGTDERESATYGAGSSTPAIEHPNERAEVKIFRAWRRHKFRTFRDEGFEVCCQR
jgi:hypothetical protein